MKAVFIELTDTSNHLRIINLNQIIDIKFQGTAVYIYTTLHEHYIKVKYEKKELLEIIKNAK